MSHKDMMTDEDKNSLVGSPETKLGQRGDLTNRGVP